MGTKQARLRAAAIAFQVAVIGGCAAVGWHLTHATGPSTIRLQQSGQLPLVGFATRLAQPAFGLVPKPAGTGARPGLPDLVSRVNGDDTRLYRGQWDAIKLVASATQAYLERHIVPLLLAAARGAQR